MADVRSLADALSNAQNRGPQTESPVRGLADGSQLAMEAEVLGLFFKSPSVNFVEIMRDYGPALPLYTATYRELVRVMFDLLDHKVTEIDVAVIAKELAVNNSLERYGGVAGLEQLANNCIDSVEEFPSRVQKLRDFHTVRKVRTLLETCLHLLQEQKRDPQQILNLLKWDLEKIQENLRFDEPQTLNQVLDGIHQRTLKGKIGGFRTYATGFESIDRAINGISQGELILIGGAQGVGKTIMSLQMARNLAYTGEATVLYICYEHAEEYLLKRLIPMESVNPFGLTPFDLGLIERDVLEGIKKASDGKVGFVELLRTSQRGKLVLEKIEQYQDRMVLFKGNTMKTTLQSIRWMAQNLKNEKGHIVVFVDYLQKVPVFPEPNTEEEKVTIIVEGLKDIALSLEIPIVTVVAADREGLKAKRMRLHHLRGGSAIDYEADIALILNDKAKIISKNNVAYNPSKLLEYERWVVATIEKNRTGRKYVDLEFEKHFKFFCFDPRGRQVQEQLIEEKLFTE
ncbi:MAG: DnaB-like helicase C-terminal domain-containing protein [bacterium]